MKLEMFKKLIEKTKGERSLQEFSDALTEGIRDLEITKQTIWNWSNGTHAPNDWWLIRLVLKTKPGDWRYKFGTEALAILSPDALHYIEKFYNK